MPLPRHHLLLALSAVFLCDSSRAEDLNVERSSSSSPAARVMPQTMPTLTGAGTLPRRMLWDRTKLRVDLARQQATMREAQLAAAKNPDDGAAQKRAEQARATYQELLALQARDELAADKEVKLEKAAYLGIASSPATPVMQKQLKIPEGVGLVVDYVEPGSPAEKAGLQPFDLATRLNEQILVNAKQLAVLVRTFDPGTKITLTVYREGRPMPVEVTLVEREVKPLSSVDFGRTWGVSLESDFNPYVASPVRRPVLADTKVKPGDRVELTVYDLEGIGLQTTMSTKVSSDGKIKPPYLQKEILATGLSEALLQRAIADAYRKEGVLDQANVSVRCDTDARKDTGG